MGAIKNEGGNYAAITGGKIRRTKVDGREIDSDTPGAISREVENPKTKEISVKWELVEDGWQGYITNISFKEDKQFGNQWIVTMEDGTDKINLTFKHKSKYFTTFMAVLPNVDFSEMVVLMPYQYKDDNNREKTGISLKQNNQKVLNHYTEGEGDSFKYINGYPIFEGDYNEDNWDDHMKAVRKFLKSEFENKIKSKFESAPSTPEPEDDLPF